MVNFALEDEEEGESLLAQALEFCLHTVIAVGTWLGMMLVGYSLNLVAVPQPLVLAFSIAIPLIVGNLLARFWPNETAPNVWLAGLIWILALGLWILDLPTGPNTCMDCSATGKLLRSFFSIPRPSGLLDNNGPFFGTWPAAALFGYSIGARLALRGRNR